MEVTRRHLLFGSLACLFGAAKPWKPVYDGLHNRPGKLLVWYPEWNCYVSVSARLDAAYRRAVDCILRYRGEPMLLNGPDGQYVNPLLNEQQEAWREVTDIYREERARMVEPGTMAPSGLSL